ncbi:MAG: hypothetical protein M0Q38_06365 [Bacteroidales bacterium]|nr:hypothetical protein [Bacteroidales bacterium]
MKKIMHILFLSCYKATLLIEKKLQLKLSLSEKIRLILHKSMCDACTRYEKQSKLINKVLANSALKKDQTPDLTDLKKEIINKLQDLN